MPVTNSERRPLFVTIFATALSSICFGISIVAIGVVWLNIWQQPPLPTIPRKRKPDPSRRRSAPASLESTRTSTEVKPPSIIAPSNHSPSESMTRRVYFVDMSPQHRNSIKYSPRLSESSPPSPHSSSSTLSSTPPPAYLPPLNTCEESAVESDNSSSRKSYRPAFKLPKLMAKAHRRVLSGAEGYASQSDDPSLSAPIKRSNTGSSFQRNWQMPRIRRTSIDSAVPDSPSGPSSRMSFRIPGSRIASTPVTSSIQDSTSPKNNYQQSISNKVPVLRTHPYEYPYFATPPTSTRDERQGYSDPERTPTLGDRVTERRRSREQKQSNSQAQAALGWGRPLRKRRSNSEGCVRI